MKAKEAAASAAVLNPVPVTSYDYKRDAYGFAVRPQHLQRYREYANIYKEEEEERSDKWKNFLERQSESGQLAVNGFDESNKTIGLNYESTNITADDSSKNVAEPDDSDGKETKPNSLNEVIKEVPSAIDGKVHRVQTWTEIRPSLRAIEDLMSSRVKKVSLNENESDLGVGKQLPSIEEARHGKGASEEDSEEEFYDLERSESDPIQDAPSGDSTPATPVGLACHDGLRISTSLEGGTGMSCSRRGSNGTKGRDVASLCWS